MTKIDASDINSMATIEQIKEQLNSKIIDDRKNALLLLMKSKYEETNELLEKVIECDKETTIRERALIILKEKEAENLFEISKKLFLNNKENRFMRARAIWAIGRLKSQQSFEFLEKALLDKDSEVLYWAIKSLLYYDYTQYLDYLQNILLTNRSFLVRQTIAWFFGTVKKESFRELLETQMLQDNHTGVRSICAWSLKNINNLQSISNICKALQEESNELTRREMTYSVGKILRSQSSEVKQTQDFEKAKDIAVRCFNRVLERDQSYIVRRACAEGLGKLHDIRTLPTMIEALSVETNQFVRKEIIKSLGELGDQRALTILNKSKKSNYRIVSEAAKIAIEEIKRRNQ